ncbi:MAG: superoxide dismutase, partial [Sphingomicrobium sp.]
MAFQLPELPYAKDALAPVMSAETLDYHWGKHHRAYVNKTNELIQNEQNLSGASLLQVVREAKRAGNSKLFNNSAQLWNHSFFWQCLAPAGGQQPGGKLAKLIEDGFGNPQALIDKLQEESVNHFASGWGWLVLD